jgi:hypothetical protein
MRYSRLKRRLGYAAGLPARGEEKIVSEIMTTAAHNQLFIRDPNRTTA